MECCSAGVLSSALAILCWLNNHRMIACLFYPFSDNLSQLPCSNMELLKGIDDQLAYYDSVTQLAENIRYAHEFGSVSFDVHQSSTVQSSKASFESKLNSVKKVTTDSRDVKPSAEEVQSSAAKDAFEQR